MMSGELNKTHHIFREHGIDDPVSEIQHLANIISGGELQTLDRSLKELSQLDLVRVARKRKEGIPIEYILGMTTFAGLRLFCTDKTLVPTEHTRLLVDTAADFIRQRQTSSREQTIIEIGTGCGSIAIAIAKKIRDVKILATDICPEALEVARKNIDKYNLQDVITLFCGDLFSPFSGGDYDESIDMIVCNPPYIPTSSLTNLPPEVKNYQPKIALEAGPYGINFYQRLIIESLGLLKPEGCLVFEIGERQEYIGIRLIERSGAYKDIKHFSGEDNIIRVLSAMKR